MVRPCPGPGRGIGVDAVVTRPDYALQKAGLANHNVKLDDNNFPLFVTSDVVGGMLDEQMTRALHRTMPKRSRRFRSSPALNRG